MGEIIPLGRTIQPPNDEDILTDIFIGLIVAAEDLGYQSDRISWLRRLETVLAPTAHTEYAGFTEELWDQ